MSPFVIFPYYLAWHYTFAIRDFFGIWGNMIWFTYQYFSIPILLKTLFSPFKRLKEYSKGGLDIGSFFEALVVNTIMRLVGFILRSVVILIGLISLSISILLGLAAFFLWLILPVLIIFLMITGLIGIFK